MNGHWEEGIVKEGATMSVWRVFLGKLYYQPQTVTQALFLVSIYWIFRHQTWLFNKILLFLLTYLRKIWNQRNASASSSSFHLALSVVVVVVAVVIVVALDVVVAVVEASCFAAAKQLFLARLFRLFDFSLTCPTPTVVRLKLYLANACLELFSAYLIFLVVVAVVLFLLLVSLSLSLLLPLSFLSHLFTPTQS